MKTRLIFIAIMFIVINLVFYFLFDSSIGSTESDEYDAFDIVKNTGSNLVVMMHLPLF